MTEFYQEIPKLRQLNYLFEKEMLKVKTILMKSQTSITRKEIVRSQSNGMTSQSTSTNSNINKNMLNNQLLNSNISTKSKHRKQETKENSKLDSKENKDPTKHTNKKSLDSHVTDSKKETEKEFLQEHSGNVDGLPCQQKIWKKYQPCCFSQLWKLQFRQKGPLILDSSRQKNK